MILDGVRKELIGSGFATTCFGSGVLVGTCVEA
jgi:hypothetical protein